MPFTPTSTCLRVSIDKNINTKILKKTIIVLWKGINWLSLNTNNKRMPNFMEWMISNFLSTWKKNALKTRLVSLYTIQIIIKVNKNSKGSLKKLIIIPPGYLMFCWFLFFDLFGTLVTLHSNYTSIIT